MKTILGFAIALWLTVAASVAGATDAREIKSPIGPVGPIELVYWLHFAPEPAGDVVKGYRYADCQAAFDRYLQIPATCAATSATASYAPTIVADVAAQKHGIGEEEQRELEIERAGMQADA